MGLFQGCQSNPIERIYQLSIDEFRIDWIKLLMDLLIIEFLSQLVPVACVWAKVFVVFIDLRIE